MKYYIIIISVLVANFAIGQTIENSSGNDIPSINNFRKYQPFNQNIDALNPDYTLFDACMQFAVNEQRAKFHLSVLPWNIALESAAYFHSKSMSKYNYFSHYNMLDSTRLNAENRAQLAGIINPLMGECIAQMSLLKPTYLGMCDEFIKLWMNSPPHRKIILSENANAIGLGLYVNDKADIYATLDVQCFRIAVYNVNKVVDKLPFTSFFQSGQN